MELVEIEQVENGLDHFFKKTFKGNEDQIVFLTWDKFLKMPLPNLNICGTHVCRSPGFTPPWCDEDFNKFISTYTSEILPIREI